jgi:hypothetical protein
VLDVMRRCASWGLTGRGLVFGRSVRAEFISWVWPSHSAQPYFSGNLSRSEDSTWTLTPAAVTMAWRPGTAQAG